MNKGDLINEVSKVLKNKKDEQAAVDCVFSSISNALGNGDSVSLNGFGSFKVAEGKRAKAETLRQGKKCISRHVRCQNLLQEKH